MDIKKLHESFDEKDDDKLFELRFGIFSNSKVFFVPPNRQEKYLYDLMEKGKEYKNTSIVKNLKLHSYLVPIALSLVYGNIAAAVLFYFEREMHRSKFSALPPSGSKKSKIVITAGGIMFGVAGFLEGNVRHRLYLRNVSKNIEVPETFEAQIIGWLN